MSDRDNSDSNLVQDIETFPSSAVSPSPSDSLLKNTTTTTTTPSQRLPELDLLRGFIMVLMAIDHLYNFTVHPNDQYSHRSESWNSTSDHRAANFPQFATRQLTHLCAPGFSMLMGTGMVFLSKARRRQGWSSQRVLRFFCIRGVLLAFLDCGMAAGYLGQFAVGPLGVLGINMLIGSVLLLVVEETENARVRLVWFAGIGFLSVLLTTIAVESLRFTGKPATFSTAFFFTGGSAKGYYILYPCIPWLAPLCFGFSLAPYLQKQRGFRTVWVSSLSCFLLFCIMRGLWWGGVTQLGSYISLDKAQGRDEGEELDVDNPVHHVPNYYAFMDLSKYPPSLCFLLWTIGWNLVCLSGFKLSSARWGLKVFPLAQLNLFGKTALFFYFLHFLLFLLLSMAFTYGIAGLGWVYVLWFLLLMAMYPLCDRWLLFKSTKDADSLWRFF
eukprot:gb/GEZN01008010.1/.p1 GENE.gb/GEZN01008010.1/~~gb/GEZN01008010.1/.p1  ORF type:complete len:456 (-),score=30.77 gb/GEZN01008010.1/:109-1431(-)